MGRPNVGKSTLVNGMLLEDRVITNDLPGTTRDSVYVQWIHKGRRIVLVDTAGIRPARKSHLPIDQLVDEDVEKALKYSHIVVLVIDAMHAFMKQDFMIINKIMDEGRGVVIVANKWDAVPDKYRAKAVKWMQKQIERGLGQAKGIPIAFISAKTGQRVPKVMDEVLRVYEKWNTRVSSGLVNRWLTQLKKIQKFPGVDGRFVKIRYLMQTNVRPPTFYMFVNDKKLVDETFRRFIRNRIIKEFGLEGVPLRVMVRDQKQVYKNKGYENLTKNTQKVIQRIRMYKKKMAKPTY